MHKKVMLAFILIIGIFSQSARATDSPQEIAIIQMKVFDTEEINQLLQSFPSLKKRYEFKEAFIGFSVEGPAKEIEKLAKSQKVEMVSKAQTYTVEQESPAEIIGATTIRKDLDASIAHLTGKGIKIGVIDTGIDYRHPDLQQNYKGGWDLVDKDRDPMETKELGLRNTIHGTHVAGIIAANGKIKGVAPNASLYAYRALGPGGSGTTEQILAAIERAVKDKVDIINLSLGSDINGPDLPISIALNKVMEKGIVAVAAAGNAGPANWTVGSPGTATKAISVGASTPYIKRAYMIAEQQEILLVNMDNSKEWQNGTADIVKGGLGRKEELKHVKGKVVLIERGELTFSTKVQHASEAGAIGVIIYNNSEGELQGALEMNHDIPVATITKKEGEWLKDKIRNVPIRVEIHKKWEKDILADFSSRGPVTSTWDIKPDIVAPGVVINSTVPNGYLALQGTSMAAPHVAGACALLLESHPNWNPEEVKAALMNTAKPLKNRQNVTYKVYEQGAGRIQIDDAVRAEILVMPGSIRFGKFKLVNQLNEYKAYITVKNKGEKKEKLSFSIPTLSKGIRWRLPLSFYLNPGESKKLPIIMEMDRNIFKDKLHDGIIELHAGSHNISIPYLYVVEEPDYPRIMGFDLTRNDKKGVFEYEAYLPTGAEEFGIAIFMDGTLHFTRHLDWKGNVKRGRIKGSFPIDEIPKGSYRMKILAKKAGKVDILEKMLEIK